VANDILTNQGSGTVTSGGTTAPAQGTSESWTVTAANAFPQVSVAAGTTFKIVDPAQQTEIMMVTVAPGGTGAGQSWTVTRGAEGTTPVVHAANCTVYEIITSGVLGNLASSVVALAPGVTPLAIETWHTIILDSGWSTAAGKTVPAYRMLPHGAVEFIGYATHANFTVTTSLNTSNPIPAAYRPVNQQYVKDPGLNRPGIAINGNGTIGVYPPAAGMTQMELTGIIVPVGI
jgi:hypothetical protein